jgi:predicted component of type VI protein secretion system
MTSAEPGPHAATAPELKAQIEAERTGHPFLVYRDEAGEQRLVAVGEGATELWVGRSSSADVRLVWDEEVSALHAQLEVVRDECTLVDEGLSRNGSYVNGERVSGRQRLRDGDMLRFGRTVVLYRAPAAPEAPPTSRRHSAACSSPCAVRSRRGLLSPARPPTSRSRPSCT